MAHRAFRSTSGRREQRRRQRARLLLTRLQDGDVLSEEERAALGRFLAAEKVRRAAVEEAA